MNNLGFSTDLIFLEDTREIVEQTEYTAFRSPNNPTYYFGNFLLLPQAPKNSEKQYWENHFDQAFSNIDGIGHYTFIWHTAPTNISTYLAANYEYCHCLVLSAQVQDLCLPKHLNRQVQLQAFSTTTHWQQWIDLGVEERPKAHDEKAYRRFMERSAAQYQQLYKGGQGNFYGAFDNGELVASAGLFYGNNVGRFQRVLTKTSHRKQGICKTLLAHMCKLGFAQASTLVMLAESDYHALKIYQKLGFVHKQDQFSLCWWPRNNA